MSAPRVLPPVYPMRRGVVDPDTISLPINVTVNTGLAPESQQQLTQVISNANNDAVRSARARIERRRAGLPSRVIEEGKAAAAEARIRAHNAAAARVSGAPVATISQSGVVTYRPQRVDRTASIHLNATPYSRPMPIPQIQPASQAQPASQPFTPQGIQALFDMIIGNDVSQQMAFDYVAAPFRPANEFRVVSPEQNERHPVHKKHDAPYVVDVPEETKDTGMPNTTCVVCTVNRVHTVVVPCGHTNMCIPCARMLCKRGDRNLNDGHTRTIKGKVYCEFCLRACPTCRTPIDKIGRLYFDIQEPAAPTPAPEPTPAPASPLSEPIVLTSDDDDDDD